MATLRLEPAVHTHDVADGRVRRHPQSHFLDFIVNGISLRRTGLDAGDLVTELNRSWWSGRSAAVETLTGRRPAPGLASGRVPLLVCGDCGDLACGAVTVALRVGPREVTWSDFRWEDGHSAPIDSPVLPIVFDRDRYEAELAGADDLVAALSDDEPLFEEHPRRGWRARWWRRRGSRRRS